jgi:hypothetical protein
VEQRVWRRDVRSPPYMISGRGFLLHLLSQLAQLATHAVRSSLLSHGARESTQPVTTHPHSFHHLTTLPQSSTTYIPIVAMSKHPHPMHIDIPPPQSDPELHEDDLVSPGPSGARPTPARGILKNPLRRPSQVGDQAALSPATDAERQAADQ